MAFINFGFDSDWRGGGGDGNNVKISIDCLWGDEFIIRMCMNVHHASKRCTAAAAFGLHGAGGAAAR